MAHKQLMLPATRPMDLSDEHFAALVERFLIKQPIATAKQLVVVLATWYVFTTEYRVKQAFEALGARKSEGRWVPSLGEDFTYLHRDE